MAAPVGRESSIRIRINPISTGFSGSLIFEPFWLMLNYEEHPFIYSLGAKIISSIGSQLDLANQTLFYPTQSRQTSLAGHFASPIEWKAIKTRQSTLIPALPPVFDSNTQTPQYVLNQTHIFNSIHPQKAISNIPSTLLQQNQNNVSVNSSFDLDLTSFGNFVPSPSISINQQKSNGGPEPSSVSPQNSSKIFACQAPLGKPTVHIPERGQQQTSASPIAACQVFQIDLHDAADLHILPNQSAFTCSLWLDGCRLPDNEKSSVLRDGDKVQADVRYFKSKVVDLVEHNASGTAQIQDNSFNTTLQNTHNPLPLTAHGHGDEHRDRGSRKRQSSNSECDSRETAKRVAQDELSNQNSTNGKKKKKKHKKSVEKEITIETEKAAEISNTVSKIDEKIVDGPKKTRTDAEESKSTEKRANESISMPITPSKRTEDISASKPVSDKKKYSSASHNEQDSMEAKSKKVKTRKPGNLFPNQYGPRSDQTLPLETPKIDDAYEDILNQLTEKRMKLLRESSTKLPQLEAGSSPPESEAVKKSLDIFNNVFEDDYNPDPSKKRKRNRRKKKGKKLSPELPFAEPAQPLRRTGNYELNLPAGQKPQNNRMVFNNDEYEAEEDSEVISHGGTNGNAELVLPLAQDNSVNSNLHTSELSQTPSSSSSILKEIFGKTSSSSSSTGVNSTKKTCSNADDSRTTPANSEVKSGRKSRKTVAGQLFKQQGAREMETGGNEAEHQSLKKSPRFTDLVRRHRNRSGTSQGECKSEQDDFHETNKLVDLENTHMAHDFRKSKGPQQRKDATFVSSSDTLTDKSIVLENTGLSGDAPQSELVEVVPLGSISDITDYSQCAVMTEPPKAGDIIAFKILELAEDYTPGLSDFQEVKVLSCDPATGRFQGERRGEITPKRQGRFEMQFDTDEETDGPIVYLEFNTLIDPRFVTHEPLAQ